MVFLVEWVAIYVGYPAIFFSYFICIFWDSTFYKKKYWLQIGAYIQGIQKGVVIGGQDEYLEGEIAKGSISHGQASSQI